MKKRNCATRNSGQWTDHVVRYVRRLRINDSRFERLYERLLVPFLEMFSAHAVARTVFDAHGRHMKMPGVIVGAISRAYWQSVGAYRRSQRIFQHELPGALSDIDIGLRKARLWEKRLARIGESLPAEALQRILVERERSHEFVRMIIRMDNCDWEMLGDLALQRNFLRDADKDDGGQPASGFGSNPKANSRSAGGQSTALVRSRQIGRTN